MAQFTRQAIIHSFFHLVSQKPLDKITVKDIVEDCEITRNTFYYHFQDIYDLTAAAFHSEFANILKKQGAGCTGWKLLHKIAEFAQQNRTALLHIFRSSRRDELLRIFDTAVQSYIQQSVQQQFPDAALQPEDLQLFAQTLSSAFVGLALDWIQKGMRDDPTPAIDRLERLFGDVAALAMKQCMAAPEK